MKRFKEKKKIQNWKERESSSGQSSDVATHSSGSSAETPVFFFFFNTTLSLLYCIKESKSLSFTVLFRSVVIFFSSIKIRPPKRASLEQVSSSLYSLSLLDFFVFFYSFFFLISMGIHRLRFLLSFSGYFSSFSSSFGNRKGDCNLNPGMKRHWHRCAALFLTAKKRAQAIHPPWSIHITERGRDVPITIGWGSSTVLLLLLLKRIVADARVSFVNFRDFGA